MVRMSALIQLAQMKIQLALVQKQLAFWTQLAYNFRLCRVSQPRICTATPYGKADAKVVNTDCLSHPARV